MKTWGKDILGIGAAGAVGAVLGVPVVSSAIAGGFLGKWIYEFFQDEDDEEFDEEFDENNFLVCIAMAGVLAKIIFPPNKKTLSFKDEKTVFQKLEKFHFDQEGVDFTLSIIRDVLAGNDLVGKFKLDELLVELRGTRQSIDIAENCVATAIDDGIWSSHEVRAYANICNLLDISIPTQDAIRDNAWIIRFIRTHEINGQGTGFFINDKGVLLTNQHVATKKQELYVKLGESMHKAEVLYENPDLDFAIAQIGVTNNPYLKIQQTPVKLGDKFAIYGYPESCLNGYSMNRTAGEVASLTGFSDNRTRFRIDAIIHHGNSGGPVVNKKSREVIGIATEGHGDTNNYAIKASEFFEEMKDYLPVEDNEAKEHQTEDAVVHLFCGREIIDEPDDLYSGWSFEEMCEHYESADSSEKWEIFNACRLRDWPNPY